MDKSLTWINVGETSAHRHFVRNFVASQRRKGSYKAIDMGGGADSWTADFVDVTVDLAFQEKASELKIEGDLLDPNTYKQFEAQSFDLAILSHILEDVRDPFFLLKEAFKISKRVFVSVPHKTLEFRSIESLSFTGFHHHRFIFSSDGNSLFVTPKTSLTNAWINSPSLFSKNVLRSRMLQKKLGLYDTVIGWNRNLKNLPAIKIMSPQTSLSCILDSPNQISSLDYIRSGESLLETYRMILSRHEY